jgi:hypothetical protein
VVANILYVPERYPTIQSAIDIAVTGDVIEVADGIYFENISFNGKRITVKSFSDIPNRCTISGSQRGSCVTMIGDCDVNSILQGFTLTQGFDTRGAGVHINSNGFTIKNCVFTGNVQKASGAEMLGLSLHATVYDFWVIEDCVFDNEENIDPDTRTGIVWINGSWNEFFSDLSVFKGNVIKNCRYNISPGVGIWSCPVIFDNNIIYGNTAFYGPPVHIRLGCAQLMNQFGIIRNNIIYNNIVNGPNHWFFKACGGGLFVTVDWQSRAFIINNTIYGNYATYSGGGIMCTYAFGGNMNFVNNIVWGNDTCFYQGDGSEISLRHLNNSTALFSHNTVKEGECRITSYGPGKTVIKNVFCVFPEFMAPNLGDFHLSGRSPCIDMGLSGVWFEPLKDFEGDRRCTGEGIDLGADETCPYAANRR